MEVEPGDKVIYSKYAGTTVKLEDTEYRRCDTDERERIGRKFATRARRNVLDRDG